MTTNSQRARLGSQRRLTALLRWAWSRASLRRPLLRLILATVGCVGPSEQPSAELASADYPAVVSADSGGR